MIINQYPQHGGANKTHFSVARKGRYRLLPLAINVACLSFNPAYAATWSGGTSDDWFDASNWMDVSIPGTSSQVLINDTAIPVLITRGLTAYSSSSVIGRDLGSTGAVTVTGAGSVWENTDLLIVGAGGTGTLTVADGATLTSGLSSIGYGSGSTGAVTVTGAGSVWGNTNSLFVGQGGTGTLTVADGATLTSNDSTIGSQLGSTGGVKVTGADSMWKNTGYLGVGVGGTGSLTVADGAILTSNDSTIGGQLGSTGAVTVTGAGSVLNTDYLGVGFDGTGTLTVADGATLSSNFSYIGLGSGSTGTVTVTGAGSVWKNTDYLGVGFNGTGKLTVADGATLTSDYSVIGQYFGSTGTVTVTGAGSVWKNRGYLVVGDGGTGTLTVADGAILESDSSILGEYFGSTGAATVTGAGTMWHNVGFLHVGDFGTGTLTVADSATLTSNSSYIGYGSGSTGTVTVTGVGSVWNNADDLNVGRNGTGTLTVADGGKVVTGNLNVTGTLNAEVGYDYPPVTAQTADIGANAILNVSGYHAQVSDTASALANSIQTVIQTAAPGHLTGAFASVNIGGSVIPVDYLKVTPLSDGQYYQVGLGLTWYAAQSATAQDAHGTFTLVGAQEKFNVDVVLADEVANAVTGWGGTSLTKAGAGTLLLSQDNTYSGGTTIQGGTLQLGNGGTTGSLLGDIANEGALVINRSNTYAYDGVISGNGTVTQQGSGHLVLNQAQTYSGVTNVNAGALILVQGAQLTNTPTVAVAEGAMLGGYGGVGGDVINYGLLAVADASGVATNRVARGLVNTFSVGGELVNHGAINLAGLSAGNRLVVAGDYIGHNGLLTLNTVLGGDDSVTDKLVVSGNTHGSTQVVVNNTLGRGAQTVNGIEVVSVGGQSDGQFTLKNRVVAGAYEYLLSQTNGNWYLKSMIPNTTKPILRPEAGNYLSNMAMASTLFNLSLTDREGRAEDSSLWLRQEGAHNRSGDSSGQLKTTSNRYVVQGGGEVMATQFGDRDRLGMGVMVGYGHGQSHTDSAYVNHSSKGSLAGYTAGVYATWYQNADNLQGAYVDTWLQYSWLNAEVKGDTLAQQSYDIKGVTGSVESGYRLLTYQGVNGDVFVTPQAQVIWSDMRADNVTESNGTHVQSDGDNNIQTRLGVRVSRDGVSEQDKGKDRLFTTYVEANWLYNRHQVRARLNDIDVEQAGRRNVGEVKLGVIGKLNQHTQMWTHVGQQVGRDGYSETALVMGMKYMF